MSYPEVLTTINWMVFKDILNQQHLKGLMPARVLLFIFLLYGNSQSNNNLQKLISIQLPFSTIFEFIFAIISGYNASVTGCKIDLVMHFRFMTE